MKKIALALASLAMFATGTAQTSQRLTAGKASEYGLVYTLPQTAVDIYLEAEITEQQPGEFYNYARRHLGITDAITMSRRSAELKNVVIVPRGVVDPQQQWLAQFKVGTSAYMTLTENNIPLAINSEARFESEMPEIPVACEAAPSALETPAARQAVTQEMARSASASKKAELTAQRIFELRETRSDILSGEAENYPSDGDAMRLVLDNLSAQEAALTAMFAGTKTSRTVVEKVSLVPDSAEVSGMVLARLSTVEGIVDADNLAGAPITLDIKILEAGTLPLTEKGEQKTFPRGGVAYRIPGKALVTINYAGREVASQEVSMAQLGVVFGLNPALFTDKKQPYSLVFDPTTGAVVKLEPMGE